jgi:hypothetical protein
VACEMGSNELIITELVFNNQLTERPPEEIAALLSRNVSENIFIRLKLQVNQLVMRKLL